MAKIVLNVGVNVMDDNSCKHCGFKKEEKRLLAEDLSCKHCGFIDCVCDESENS